MSHLLPKTDVVIVGLGWTGSIMAHELTDQGLEVVAIERGPWRDSPTDFPVGYMQDELRYRVRHELFLRPDQLTFTFRNKIDQTALPIRSWGAFMPQWVGGGGVHWNAETWRFASDTVGRSHLTQRYEAFRRQIRRSRRGITATTWSHSTISSNICAASGTAGNLKARSKTAATSRAALVYNAGTSTAFQLHAIRQGGARTWLQAVPAALGESITSIHEPARSPPWALHLLRLLRMVWLRQLLKGQPPNDDLAGPDPQIQFHRAG